MPTSNSTGTTINTAPFCLFVADRTISWSFFWSEVFIMIFAMTINAVSNPIINIKSQLRILRKRFYMMGMNFLFVIATFLANIFISCKNFFSPLSQFVTCPCSLSIERLSILPCRGSFSFMMFKGTFKRTIFFTTRSFVCKNLFAVKTNLLRGSLFPTFLTAIFRSLRPVTMLSILFFTYRANKNYSFSSLIARLSFYSRHFFIIHYCDVIVKKYEKFSGKKAELCQPS